MDLQEAQAKVMPYVRAASDQFQRIPGSAIIIRYITASYQNDPVRTMVEFVLFAFAVHYLLSPKYSTKHGYVQLSDEVWSLISSYIPRLLVVSISIAICR